MVQIQRALVVIDLWFYVFLIFYQVYSFSISGIKSYAKNVLPLMRLPVLLRMDTYPCRRQQHKVDSAGSKQSLRLEAGIWDELEQEASGVDLIKTHYIYV